MGFEKDGEEAGAPEDRMHGAAFEKAVEGVSSAVRKVWAEAVAADVFQLVFVW